MDEACIKPVSKRGESVVWSVVKYRHVCFVEPCGSLSANVKTICLETGDGEHMIFQDCISIFPMFSSFGDRLECVKVAEFATVDCV